MTQATKREAPKPHHKKEQITQRIAKLTGGVAEIQVGAASEVELKERKLRIEDALNATKAAKEEGIVAGGGYTLLDAQSYEQSMDLADHNSTDYVAGYQLLINALSLPAYQIADNAGVNGDVVVTKCKEDKLGYNALTNTYEDLVSTGVIDPAKVTRCALQNAASIASMFLTTEAAIVDEPSDDSQSLEPRGMAPMM